MNYRYDNLVETSSAFDADYESVLYKKNVNNTNLSTVPEDEDSKLQEAPPQGDTPKKPAQPKDIIYTHRAKCSRGGSRANKGSRSGSSGRKGMLF